WARKVRPGPICRTITSTSTRGTMAAFTTPRRAGWPSTRSAPASHRGPRLRFGLPCKTSKSRHTRGTFRAGSLPLAQAGNHGVGLVQVDLIQPIVALEPQHRVRESQTNDLRQTFVEAARIRRSLKGGRIG